MEYWFRGVIVNDDLEPSSESVAHLLAHLLRGEGAFGIIVTTSEDSDVVPDHELHRTAQADRGCACGASCPSHQDDDRRHG